ncbi:scaffolding protein [Chryseomicrobium aureum]|uniref:scaffolding protein n=1 Tax=Chryseomicrobium aureum TaxID=1441723 RepID=UPI00370DAFE2
MKLFNRFYVLYALVFSFFTKPEATKSFEYTPLKLDLQFFAGDPDPDDDPDGGTGKGEDKPFAVFNNKEDLDKRISRAEKAGQKALAKQLGFETVEEMQAALKKEEPADPKGKDEKKDKAPDVDEIIDAKLKEERAKTFTRLLTSEVKVVAKELGFADYEDALKLADLSEVKENEKGEIEGVEEALKALSEKKPHLLEKSNKGGFGSDISNKKKQSEKDRLESIKKMAQNRGVQVQASVNDPWKR